jgi:MYXO-CTERM domain-containing protein
LETLGKGDLNFDGVTDVFDLALMQQALAAAGVATIASSDLLGVAVPEPTCGWLAAAALTTAAGRRRRRTA